jgi:diguanylate cyclase (GGDEF)-like protein
MTVFDKVNYLLRAASLLVEKHDITLLWVDADLRIRFHQPQDISWLYSQQQHSPGLRITDLFVELFGMEQTLLDVVHGAVDHFDIELVEKEAPNGKKVYYSYSFYPCVLDSNEPGLLMVCERSRLSDLIGRLTQSYSDLRLLHAEVTRSITTDAMTQVGNRYALVKAISDRGIDIQKRGQDLVIAAIDLVDNQKAEEKRTPQQNDLLLQQFGQALKVEFGGETSVFRMSGDEFVVFVPSRTVTDFEKLAEDFSIIEKQIRSEGFLQASVNAGFAALSERGYNFWDTLQLADRRMYQARRSRQKG